MQRFDVQNPSRKEDAELLKKTTFMIRSVGPDAGGKVNAWIEEAFEWYKDFRKSERDDSRFFFVALADDSKDKGPGGPRGGVTKATHLYRPPSLRTGAS